MQEWYAVEDTVYKPIVSFVLDIALEIITLLGFSTYLRSSSYDQSDLQLVLFDNFVLLCHKFRHVPSAIDVPPR